MTVSAPDSETAPPSTAADAAEREAVARLFDRLHDLADIVPRHTPDSREITLRCRQFAEAARLGYLNAADARLEAERLLVRIDAQYRLVFHWIGLIVPPNNPHDVVSAASVLVLQKSTRGFLWLVDLLVPMGSRRRALLSLPLRFWRSVRQRGWTASIADSWARAQSRFGAWRSGIGQGDEVRPADHAGGEPNDFDGWIAARRLRPRADLPTRGPVISVILPVYRVPHAVLRRTIDSILTQTYQDWQICVALADLDHAENRAYLTALAAGEPRVALRILDRNGGISANSNAAFDLATGSFIALVDHDDEISPDAFAEAAAAIARRPEVDMWYSDRDIVTAHGERRIQPLFKPDWSPEMLLSANYLTHLDIIRRSVIVRIGGWRPETDGAQDWDLFLRVGEVTGRIARFPGIHYHWRMVATSASTGLSAKPYVPQAQRRAVQSHLDRRGLAAVADLHWPCGFHISWLPSGSGAAVVVVGRTARPTPRDLDRLTARLMPADRQRATAILALDATLTATGADFLSSLARAAAAASGTHFALIAADVDEIAPGWLNEQSGWLDNVAEIGFVTALVEDAGGRVIECGRLIAADGSSHPLLRGERTIGQGPFGSPSWYRNCRAAGPIGVMFRRGELISALAGFAAREDVATMTAEHAFTELCLEIGERRGRRGLVNPHALIRAERPAPAPPAPQSVRDDPYFTPLLSACGPLKF